MNLIGSIKKKCRIAQRNIKCKRIRTARKRRDKKTIIPYPACKNCGAELHGMYCHKCGQYALDINQPFWKYIEQFMENAYQYDGRVLTTLRMLFLEPGKLSREFMEGRINSYVHPLKFYMFVSIVFFSFILITPSQIDKAEKRQMKEAFNFAENTIGMLKDSTETTTDTLQQDSIQRAKIKEMNEVFETLELQTGRQLPEVDADSVKSSLAPGEPAVGAVASTLKDAVDVSTEAVKEQTNKKQELILSMVWQQTKAITPIAMLFLMPLYAFILKVRFRRKKEPYMGCFVFSLHIHTVIFLLLSLMMFEYILFQTSYSPLFLMGLFLIYQLLAAREFFRDTWFRCTYKTILGFATYLFICVVFIACCIMVVIIKSAIAAKMGSM